MNWQDVPDVVRGEVYASLLGEIDRIAQRARGNDAKERQTWSRYADAYRAALAKLTEDRRA